MRKKWLGVLVAGVVAGTASSGNAQNTILAFTAGSGFYAPGATFDTDPGVLNTGVNPTGQALLQFIFSPVASLNPVNPFGGSTFLDAADVAGGARILGGNQVLAESGGTLNASSEYGDGFGFAHSEAHQSGFVFARLFDGPEASIGPGHFYYESLPIAISDLTPTSPPQSININQDLAFGGFGDELLILILPEPTSLALVGLGVLGTVVARRRRLG